MNISKIADRKLTLDLLGKIIDSKKRDAIDEGHVVFVDNEDVNADQIKNMVGNISDRLSERSKQDRQRRYTHNT